MVSNGKGEIGASKLTGEILDIVARLPKAVESLTGIDISKVRLIEWFNHHNIKGATLCTMQLVACYITEVENDPT